MKILRRGDPQRIKLDKIQDDIEACAARIDATVKAPLSADDLRENVRAAIRAKADAQRTGQSFAFLRRRAESGRPPPLPALEFWAAEIFLHGEQYVEDRIVAQLSMMEPAPGLPQTKRRQLVSELQDQINTLEREEEIETLRLESVPGNVLIRRPTTDPAMLIEIWAHHETTTNGDHDGHFQE